MTDRVKVSFLLGTVVLIASIINVGCKKDSGSGGMPPELSSVAGHLTLASTVSDRNQTFTSYKVDESFDAFLAQLQPELRNGGWIESPMGVQTASQTGDRDVLFQKVLNPIDPGNVNSQDGYTLTETHAQGTDSGAKANVVLVHMAPSTQK